MSPRLAAVAVLSLAIALPAAADWSPDGNPVAIVDGFLGPYSGASDGAGGGFFAWFQFGLDDAPATLRVQHLDANGNHTWRSGGVVVTTAREGRQFAPDFVVPDGTGGVVVGWHDYQIPFRAQRFDANGRALWEPAGRPLAVQPVNFPAQALALPGGDVLIASDGHAGSSIVATRYDGRTGAVVWGPVVLCAGSSGSSSISTPAGAWSLLDGDGTGGAVATWFDTRGVVVQRVDGNGNVLWGPTGLIVSAGSGAVGTIAGDGAGGALVLWYRTVAGATISSIERVRDGRATWSAGDGVALAAMADAPPWVVVRDDAGGAWVVGASQVPDPRLVTEHVADGVEGQRVELGSLAGGLAQVLPAQGGLDAVVVESEAGGGRSIRAIRAAADGSLPWGAEGRTIVSSQAVGNTNSGAVFADGAGGLITGWYDRRTDPVGDLYAMRLDANGAVHGANTAATVRFLGTSPTPSTGAASLRFTLAREAAVTLRIVDAQGRTVCTLLRGEALPPGEHAISWNGKTNDGRAAASGIYFVDVRANGQASSGRIVLTR